MTRSTRDSAGVATWDQYDAHQESHGDYSEPGVHFLEDDYSTTTLSGNHLHVDEHGGWIRFSAGSPPPIDPEGTMPTNTGPTVEFDWYSHVFDEELPNAWDPPAALEIPTLVTTTFDAIGDLAQDLWDTARYIALHMTGTWFLTDEYQAWRARAAFEHTINPPDFEYSSLYQALSHKFVTTVMVDNERLIKGGRFGTGWADDLMIVAITISEWAGYLDPTPTSDLINAALNGIDGNYVDAGMSLAGAMIPGGGEKPIKGAGKVTKNALEGFGNAARRMNKSIDCNSANSVASFVGNMLGRCFVGDTEVVIGLAPQPAATSAGEGDAVGLSMAQSTLIAMGMGALMLGTVHFVMLDRKRRKDEQGGERDDLFDEDCVDNLTNNELEPLPVLNESQFESLCDRLFGSEEELLAKPGLDETAVDRPADSEPVDQPAASKGGVLTKPGSERALKPIARRPVVARWPRSEQPVVASTPRRTWLWLAPWTLVALLCFGAAYFTGNSTSPTGSSVTVAATSSQPSSPQKYVTQKIRDLQVCTWVLADNPETEGIEGIDYSQLDPTDYRILRVRMVKPDGSLLHVDMLHSLLWMEYENAYRGNFIDLSYPELGIDGKAAVLEVRECSGFPPRPSPKHCLVTSKFEHEAANVLDLHIEGLHAPIGVTANHPIWSEDRKDFVQAGALRVNETLLGADGSTTKVLNLVARSSFEPVYNLEVDGEHVYYVSASGLLVHNSKNYIGRNEITTLGNFKARSRIGDQLEGHELLQHAWLKDRGHATTRLSTALSKNNPAIALDRATHLKINKAQSTIDFAAQTAKENIFANRRLLLDEGIPRKKVNKLTIRSLLHVDSNGL